MKASKSKDIAGKQVFNIKDKTLSEPQLVIAIKKLAFQNKEKKKREAELYIANKELVFQNAEKKKRALELILANKALKISEDDLKEHMEGLKIMMFMTSHKVRQPIANIIGASNLLDMSGNSLEDIRRLIIYIKQSAVSLDIFTKDLISLINNLSENKKKFSF